MKFGTILHLYLGDMFKGKLLYPWACIALRVGCLLILGAGVVLAATPEEITFQSRADALLKAGQKEKAVRMYEALLKRDPEFANAHYNLATAYFLAGEPKKAMVHLEAFVALLPQDAEALYNLGCLKLRSGNFGEAERCFRRSYRIPSLFRLKNKEALQWLKSLKRQPSETQRVFSYLLA